MKIRELLGTAQVPGGDELRLFRRGDDFIIAVEGNELMSSRMSGSEEALATMTCDRLRSPDAAHLLIGGYGMGFTLRAALATLGPDARITVSELVPGIIDRAARAEITDKGKGEDDAWDKERKKGQNLDGAGDPAGREAQIQGEREAHRELEEDRDQRDRDGEAQVAARDWVVEEVEVAIERKAGSDSRVLVQHDGSNDGLTGGE